MPHRLPLANQPLAQMVEKVGPHVEQLPLVLFEVIRKACAALRLPLVEHLFVINFVPFRAGDPGWDVDPPPLLLGVVTEHILNRDPRELVPEGLLVHASFEDETWEIRHRAVYHLDLERVVGFWYDPVLIVVFGDAVQRTPYPPVQQMCEPVAVRFQVHLVHVFERVRPAHVGTL